LPKFPIRKIGQILIGSFGLSVLIALLLNLSIFFAAYFYIYDEDTIPAQPIAIVLGASVKSQGRLSQVLQDRLDTALNLYQKNKIQKFLLSGDNGSLDYNEVVPMRDYLIQQGVDPQKIFLDYAGFDTYDTMYRAQHIFRVQKAIVITQEFHLARAVFLARAKGIEAYGLKADRHHYVKIVYFRQREFLANIKAFFEVLLNTNPRFKGEVININGV